MKNRMASCVVFSLAFMLSGNVFANCCNVPGTSYSCGNTNWLLNDAAAALNRCRDGNRSECGRADKLIERADVAVVQLLTECTKRGCVEGGRNALAPLKSRAGRISSLGKELQTLTGWRRSYSNTFGTVTSWENTRACGAENNTQRCQDYANAAVRANQINTSKGCGYTGARWTNDYNGHYNWCLRAPRNSAHQETQARKIFLDNCGVNKSNVTQRCRQYATAAVRANKINTSKGCGYSGARWTNDYNGHYNWCLRAPQSTADQETQARRTSLNNCSAGSNNITQRCKNYASAAVRANQQNVSNRCGYTGARWTNDYNGHYNWCLRVPQSTADQETRARSTSLGSCSAPRRQCPGGYNPYGCL